MTGGSATVVRASIMSLIVILGKATGRMHNAALTLFIAAFLMLLHNPRILAFDPSFQLSFLATLGLVYLSPALEKYFHFVPGKWQIRRTFSLHHFNPNFCHAAYFIQFWEFFGGGFAG